MGPQPLGIILPYPVQLKTCTLMLHNLPGLGLGTSTPFDHHANIAEPFNIMKGMGPQPLGIILPHWIEDLHLDATQVA